MDKRKRDIAQYVTILVLALIIAGLLFYMIPYRYNLNEVIGYDYDSTVVDNPLMGFAPRADNEAQCELTRLVYIDVTWAEWEPKKGEYNIEALESKYKINKWKEENKHAVLRFVCDVPGEKAHRDIPEWLYNETMDGTDYSNDYGKGYSPNYANTQLVEYHKRAIDALAKYCNKDHFVAFVEMGSLGHWGEWHATGSNGENLMPSSEICSAYASHYTGSFINAYLLMRRNYEIGTKNKLGVYNDMIGSEADTDTWLEWLKNGGIQETSGSSLKLMPMEVLGTEAPIGGEFTSSIPMDTMMTSNLGEILADISTSRMTFIGPMIPDMSEEKYSVARQSILRRMGYRIYISSLSTQYDFSKNILNATMTWKNGGNASFYYDWPVTMNLYDGDKNLIYWQAVELKLPELVSGVEVTADAQIPYTDDIRDEFYITISIQDYEGNDRLILANDFGKDAQEINGEQVIYHYQRGLE